MSMCYKSPCAAPPLNPIPERESPAVKAGLIRVYVIVNNYRTNYDDFRELYLFGNQIDIGETKKLDSKNC